MTTQICLVSDQAAANLLPALDPALKPDQVILLVSAKMLPRAEALAGVLREAGVQVRQVALDDEHNYLNLQNAMLDIVDQLIDQRVMLNITGGTKLMALAAQSVAIEADWEIFYVDADTGEAIWLSDPSRRHPLEQHLRLRHYLGGYGFSIAAGMQQPSANPRHQDLIRTLVVQVGSMTTALSQLNWLAQQTESRGALRIKMDERQRDSRSLETLLRNFEDAGVLAVESGQITFAGEAERRFVKGGWLEEHVFSTLARNAGALHVRDKACNLEVIDSSNVKNELDAVFLARNRLHIIECKTARMDQPEAPKANDTLFKLAEISRRIGGLASRGMLISYRPLGKAEKQLASALRIELVCAGELVNLDQRMHDWIGP